MDLTREEVSIQGGGICKGEVKRDAFLRLTSVFCIFGFGHNHVMCRCQGL